MPKFAYSTNAFTKFSFRQTIKKIRQLGFRGMEIVFDRPHFEPKYFELTLRQAKRSGLAISNINANTAQLLKPFYKSIPSLISPDNISRTLRVKYTQTAIDLARDLGARNISLTTGPAPRGVSRKKLQTFFRSSLEQILEHASKKNIRVGIEYEPGYFIDNAEKTLAVIKKTNHKLLGVNLDLGHAVVAGEDPARVIRKFAGRIFNIHLEDIKGRTHYHLIPGQGNMDFIKIKNALAEIRYRGWLTLELYTYPHQPVRAGRLALKHLRKIFKT